MPDEADLSVPSFHGEHRYGVDESRRVMVPAKWRPKDPSMVFTVILWPVGVESHLFVLPPDRWKGLLAKLNSGSMNDEGLADLERAIGTTSAPLTLDRVGRFCLPEFLWRQAGIDKEATFIGRLDKFEIWSPARYQAGLNEPDGQSGETVSMSLGQWLAATQSVESIQDRLSPYRLREASKLPRFGRVPQTGMHSEGKTVGEKRADQDGKEPSMKHRKLAKEKSGTKLFRWVKRANPFAPRQVAAPPKPPVQAEMVLDGVKPVRNDLHDTDIVVLPARVTAAKMDAAPGHGSHVAARAAHKANLRTFSNG